MAVNCQRQKQIISFWVYYLLFVQNNVNMPYVFDSAFQTIILWVKMICI